MRMISRNFLFGLVCYLASSANAAPSVELQNLSQCLSAMGYGSDGNQGRYISMPGQGGQLLVFTENGAKIVNTSSSDPGTPAYVYVPPGQTQLNKTHIERDGGMNVTWFGVEGKASPSQFKNIPVSEAIAIAGRSAKDYKSKPRNSLKYLDSFLRSSYVSTGNGFRTETNPQGMINSERLQSKMDLTQRSLRGLSRCDSVANEDVKAAARLEREHLTVLKQKLKDYESEVKAFNDCNKSKTSTGAPVNPPKGVR